MGQLRLVHLGVRGRLAIGDVERLGLVVLSWHLQVVSGGVGDRVGCPRRNGAVGLDLDGDLLGRWGSRSQGGGVSALGGPGGGGGRAG